MGRNVETIGDNVIYFDFTYDSENDYEDLAAEDWQDLQDNIICAIAAKYKSFIVTPNQWAKYPPYQENKILLENDHVQISIAEYCGCGAISVFVRPDTEYPELAKHWLSQTWDTIQRIVSEHVTILQRLGTMSNGVGVFKKMNNSIDGKYYCESCGRLRADVEWQDNTEQYECTECYQQYLEHGD